MRRFLPACLLVLLAFAATAFAAEDPTKPIKVVVGSIRQSRDLAALKHLAGEEQGKYLLGEAWKQGTDAQRKEFISMFHTLFGKIAFPKVRQNFEHLDTILYEQPQVSGSQAEVASTIRINHPLKKQELKLKYQVVKVGGSWKVLDVAVLGDSMLQGIRDDQVAPLLKEGGWDALLKTMKAKVDELAKVPLK